MAATAGPFDSDSLAGDSTGQTAQYGELSASKVDRAVSCEHSYTANHFRT
jgi:hypothetical protein